ncbi:hypothetical protein M2401_006854 [Pseudomonas sp. JUb42]|nr:hypothetical protein [Pseudomonas sp. JUb42]MCS3473086.1 hypothetical protein [Pseudomonas sp. JUb42]
MPTPYDEAISTMNVMVGLINTEALMAVDDRDDETYTALVMLRCRSS